jgi:DNA-binding GntR family transcriptional regulator
LISHEQVRSYPAAPPASLDGRKNCANQVYVVLKSDIMEGRIAPGALLSESSLASRFGMSRTPVREALGVLASDGLITTLPQRGHVVNTVSVSEVLDAFRLREILEVEAIGQAVRRISDVEIDRLRELIAIREAADLPDINREFHTAIARASGNRLLVDFIDRLLISMQRVLIMDPRTTHWTEEGFQEEQSIVEALAAHDEECARLAIAHHIRSTLASVLRQSGPLA